MIELLHNATSFGLVVAPLNTILLVLQECLLIQIRQKLESERNHPEIVKNLRLAARLIFDLFDEFTKKHFQKMQKHLNISEEELKDGEGDHGAEQAAIDDLDRRVDAGFDSRVCDEHCHAGLHIE